MELSDRQIYKLEYMMICSFHYWDQVITVSAWLIIRSLQRINYLFIH